MSQMKSWPVEKPKSGGQAVAPEQRNKDNPCELKGSFDQKIIKKVVPQGADKATPSTY